MKAIGTFQPNNRKMKKKHGFFARKLTNILSARRKKGRKKLCK
jgi:ribosomal protein L34